ncbi:energy transducer TonB [Pseudoalteromonas ostreae]|uniref:energy transducer TonB n=1 Tax=Pseudoalteromonas ostreae TaxID=2774154 RepID=UPI001B3607F1|nr:energy transducer TonB [Pseudoalteromonas ostreae]
MSLFVGNELSAPRIVNWHVVGAFFIAAMIHAAIAGYFLMPTEHNNIVPMQASPQVFEVNIVAAPKAEPSALPVGPTQQESAPVKQQVSKPATTIDKPLVKPLLESKSDFTISDKQPEPAPSKPLEKSNQQQEQDPQPTPLPDNTSITGASEHLVEQSSAPLAIPVKESTVASGPIKGALSEQQSTAKQVWQSAIQIHLERKKRYPRMAKLRRQQGVPWVSFTIDRAGNVLDVTLFKASGIAALDNEVIELVRRAEPLPVPPEEVTGNPIKMAVPVAFFIH